MFFVEFYGVGYGFVSLGTARELSVRGKMKKKIMLVFGTRPEAIKMIPVILELQKHQDKFQSVLVSTGQHREMLDQILTLFGIKPDYDLNIMKKDQSLSDIVVNSIKGLDPIIKKEKPDLLLVQGDTSTAFAAALTAFQHTVAVGHVEAGLRTFDNYNPYPEEMNRKLISQIASLSFAPTLKSKQNLLAEKVLENTIYLTGNTVIDALFLTIKKPCDLTKLGIEFPKNKKMILLTTHRRESFGKPMEDTCSAVAYLANKYKDEIYFIFPVHPNPNVRRVVQEKLKGLSNVILTDPLDYLPFTHLMEKANFILTDSGGVQEEAPSLGKPVLVLRETTERPEAVSVGCVKLIGTDKDIVIKEAESLITDKEAYAKMAKAVNPYGDGKAAKRIVEALISA